MCVGSQCARHVYVSLGASKGAIYHQGGGGGGQLRASTFSVPDPNSAFLWKTSVILIDEIQRRGTQFCSSPTARERQGAAVSHCVARRKGRAGEKRRGEKPRIGFKRSRKRFFTATGKQRLPSARACSRVHARSRVHACSCVRAQKQNKYKAYRLV